MHFTQSLKSKGIQNRMPFFLFYNESAIRSFRPIRLKIVISLSSLRIRSVCRTSLSLEQLVVTSSITITFCWRILDESSSSIGFDSISSTPVFLSIRIVTLLILWGQDRKKSWTLQVFGKENERNGINLVAFELEKRGMLNVLENLQYHRSELVYEKVIKIIETFFPVEEV